jgi:uroporphyrinogen III methyltransferase/synthase
VDVVEAYRTVVPERPPEQAREVFGAAPSPIASPSPVPPPCENLVAAAGAKRCAASRWPPSGPVTTRTARALGIEVAAQAKVFTVDGLVEAVLGLYTEMTPPSED